MFTAAFEIGDSLLLTVFDALETHAPEYIANRTQEIVKDDKLIQKGLPWTMRLLIEQKDATLVPAGISEDRVEMAVVQLWEVASTLLSMWWPEQAIAA